MNAKDAKITKEDFFGFPRNNLQNQMMDEFFLLFVVSVVLVVVLTHLFVTLPI